MGERIYWTRETSDLFCASIGSMWGVKCYMVVEAFPSGGWDWATWSSDGSGESQHGWAETEGDAMFAAEEGARIRFRRSGIAFASSPRLYVAHASTI